MDNTFDLDGIDWENVGPSEQPTGCKGRRSDLFSDLRRPLADLDDNRLVRGGGSKAPPRAEACDSSSRSAGGEKSRRGGARDAVPPTATARQRRCYKGRRQLNADKSRCEPIDANMDNHGEDTPSTVAVCVSSLPHYDLKSAVDSELLGAQPRPLGDDVRPSCVSSGVDNAADAATAGCTAQPKSFADSLTASFSAWAASTEPSMKRRCSGSGRRSNAHELPAWDLNVVDGVAEDDVHLTDDISFGRRPRRSLRLRRKSLVGQSLLENQEDSLRNCTVSCPATSGLSSSCAVAVSTTLDEDAAVTAELPEQPVRLAESCQRQSCPSGSEHTVDFSWMAAESSFDGSSEAAGSPTAQRQSRIDPSPAISDDGMDEILETAFMVSPENVDSVGARLDSITEEECVEPCGCPPSVSESCCELDAATEAVEPNASTCRPRRRAAVQQAQQQQPDQKRRRPSKLKQQHPSKLKQQQSPQEQFTATVVADDDPVTDAALIGLYTNKPYQAPERRRLETIYEQPGVWRGQEKLMSAAPTARLLKFEPVAVGKTKQRRQKALNLGWRRSAAPDTAASHERLEQCLKDLDEALLSVHESGGDRGGNVFGGSTTASAASSNCEQLAAIETLALH